MNVRIAVIGSKKMIERILKYKNKINNIQIIPYIYKKPEESLDIVKKVNDCDVFFFTGPVPFYFAYNELKKRGLPAVHIPFDEYMISLSLYYVKNTLRQPSNRISIDIPRKEDVYSVFRELEIDTDNLFIKDYAEIRDNKGNFNTDSIVEYHYNLTRKDKVDIVLTSIEAVHLKLLELGVKSYRMLIPEKNIEDTLQKAATKGELVISKSTQIACGIVSIDNFEHLMENKGITDIQEITSKLYEILLNFGQKINASIQKKDQSKFVIYGTRGALNYIINQKGELFVLSDIRNLLKISVSLGFGFGISAKEAEQHAEIALYHARNFGGNKAYIVNDEKEVIGPLGNESKSFQLRSENDQIFSIAKRTGISITTISKFVEFIKLRHYASFSTIEFADYLQVSRRTAERNLKKLLENNVIEITGEEQPYQTGRPRSIYKITF